jgi:hypothetical protein
MIEFDSSKTKFFCGSQDRTQGLVHATKVLYLCGAIPPSLKLKFFMEFITFLALHLIFGQKIF